MNIQNVIFDGFIYSNSTMCSIYVLKGMDGLNRKTLILLADLISDHIEDTYLESVKMATSLRPRLFPSLKPSENRMTSEMSSLSGLDIATGLNSCFRLSGSF